MASMQGVLLFVSLMVGLAASIPEKCHIPDEDWEVLTERFLAQMPNEYIFPRGSNNSSKGNEVLAGITTGETTLTGLSHMKRCGAIRAYCKNGKPRVDITMVARAPLKISMPWKYCGGKSGVVATQAKHVKVCVNFEVDEIENNVTVRPVRVSPKWIETMDVELEDKCRIPDEDWEVLTERFLAQMPNEYIFPRGSTNSSKGNEVLPGITRGETTLTGLSHMKRCGAIRAYCKNGKPRVDITMVARAPLKISMPWKYCGGKSGVVATQAKHVKVCVNFEVDEIENNVTVRPVRVSPKWMETMDVELEGAGDTVKTVASILGKVMSAFVKDFWIENLPWRIHKVLEQIRK
ncbi:hypothetical protein MTO96_040850 [Rhipicephalus appendiculatus]